MFWLLPVDPGIEKKGERAAGGNSWSSFSVRGSFVEIPYLLLTQVSKKAAREPRAETVEGSSV